MQNNSKAFIIMGRSGCGKGTQIDLLKAYLLEKDNKRQILHVESGAFLREFVKDVSYTPAKIKTILDSGLLVPESVVVYLWMDYLVKNFTGSENLIFDGCPRKIDESKMLIDALKFYGIEEPVIIYMNVSEAWAMDKLLNRNEGRKDDNEKSIKNRMEYFKTDVAPVIEFLKNHKNCTFVDVNGEQPIEDVHNEILAKLGLNR